MALSLSNSAAVGVIAAALFAGALSQARAQESFPSRPIRIIVPTAPSGGSDTLARLIAQGLGERLQRPVLVDNRAGASTIIGTELVAKAPPDGYTLLLGATPLAINPATFKKLPYDALRDLVPITVAAQAANLLIVHPSVPAKTVKELIALAKARPNELLFASAGHGTNAHLTMELFMSMARIHMVHVPFKGASPGIIALVGGHVSVGVPPMFSAMPHVRSGKVRALGVTSANRNASAPDVPTIAEAALPGYEAVQWYGLLAPTGTPSEIIARLNKEIIAVLRAPASRERINGEGADVVASAPEAFAAFLRTESVKWAKVAKIAGIQPE